MIPANDMMTKADRIHIRKTRSDKTRHISVEERRVLLASLKAYKHAGSEDSKMIRSSVEDILGLY